MSFFVIAPICSCLDEHGRHLGVARHDAVSRTPRPSLPGVLERVDVAVHERVERDDLDEQRDDEARELLRLFGFPFPAEESAEKEAA